MEAILQLLILIDRLYCSGFDICLLTAEVVFGERKGTNKYYPPDYDPRKGGLNKWQGVHALRERARKLHMGILIIRFEMPFNVWCEGCENHIGMGVRYNAEKTKVGNFYSTPIFQFRMKCHLCDNYFEIRTDPKNFDYEIISGLRRQEKRWDMSQNDQVVPVDRETSNKLSTDAMYKLEHSELDHEKLKSALPQLDQLETFQKRWKDDFALNQELRNVFRTRKKEINNEKAVDDALLKKSSLDIELVKETESDRKLASMMTSYRTVSTGREKHVAKLLEIEKRDIFDKEKASNSSDLSLIIGKFEKPQQIQKLEQCVLVSRNREKISKLDQQLDKCVQAIKGAVRCRGIVDASIGKNEDIIARNSLSESDERSLFCSELYDKSSRNDDVAQRQMQADKSAGSVALLSTVCESNTLPSGLDMLQSYATASSESSSD
ncbi:Coiled-coil domain-containing protein -like protein [Trichinella nelsoni]|uniref:Coiled-coil domain-containing protein-like protein n=1 Tax=Trichinella nelsoni TaxID=6336 RepID=A0A0V0RYR3_9BILA|nr:Coiled-coil domain-containing protein -like protein [Trichinella nelsoni]